MIKKIFVTIFSIFLFMQAVFAQGDTKITSVNFDTSGAIIFITSPDNIQQGTLNKVIKPVELSNPKRIYFDIDSSILTIPAQDLVFNSSLVKELKVSQFSTNPNTVRVVLYLDEGINKSKIKFLKINNNLVIKLKDEKLEEEYFQTTYKDERASGSDFYESLSASYVTPHITPSFVKDANDVLGQIQDAFNGQPKQDKVKRNLKLNSEYYLNNVSIKQNGILINGFGRIGIERPMYLTNPSRVVFDIPHATVNRQIINQEFKFKNDTIRVGQFEASKVRVVIESEEPEKYIPIFSSDNQSILFTPKTDLDFSSLFNKSTDAVSYYTKKVDSLTDEFIMAFNLPVVHSIQRDNDKLTITLLNTLRYNEQDLKAAIKNSNFEQMKVEILPKIGLKLILPLKQYSVVKCFLGADARAVKIVLKNAKPEKDFCTPSLKMLLPRCHGQSSVIIDPGHGGADYGAIRAGINEKDINLDIAKRVQAILESKGIVVDMTRTEDKTIALQERTDFCAEKSPDIFISIHVNSSVKPEITGIETHYYHQNSMDLAQAVHASLISQVGANDRGLFKSKFYVINHTEVPAILVEIGFLSNDKERADLISEKRKNKTAKAIAEGILKYLNVK